MSILFQKDSIYIHYFPSHIKNYSNVKQKILDNYEENRFKKRVLNTMKQNNKIINKKEEEAYFDFLGCFGENNGSVKTKLQNALGNVSLPTLLDNFSIDETEYDNMYQLLGKIKKEPEVKLMSDINKRISNILEQLERRGVYEIVNKTILEEKLINLIEKEEIFHSETQSLTGAAIYEKIKKLYNELKNEKEAIIFFNNSQNFEKKDATVENFIPLLLNLRALIQKLTDNNTFQSNNLFIDYICYMVQRIPSVFGVVYEFMVKEAIQNKANDLMAEMTGSKMVNIKYTPDKKKQSIVSTQDIGFNIQFHLSKKDEATLIFDIPGASLKYSSGVKTGAKESNIKLKNEKVVLGHLLHSIDNKALSSIYNILASYNRVLNKQAVAAYAKSKNIDKEKIQKNPITTEVYKNMWAGLRIALTVNSLIGQMSKEDFSYFFVVSGKVFTVPEIIKSLVEEKETGLFASGMASLPRLDPSQLQLRNKNTFFKVGGKGSVYRPNINSARTRSQKVMKEIYNSTVVAGVNLKIRKI